MFALVPNPIPAEAGLCAVRIGAPETPAERDLAEFFPGKPIFRVVVWKEGRAWMHSFVNTLGNFDPPTLAAELYHLKDAPLLYVELLRSKT